MALKAAPGTCPIGRNSPRIRRCALDEIGRNSVRPCTRPRMIASMKSTIAYPTPSAVPQEIAQHRAPESQRRQGHALVDAVEHGRKIEVGRELQRRESVAGD